MSYNVQNNPLLDLIAWADPTVLTQLLSLESSSSTLLEVVSSVEYLVVYLCRYRRL